MTAFLPPNLLALFAPRDPVLYLPPVDKLSHEKKRQPYTGVGGFFGSFEDPKDTPPPTRVETREERLERKRREKAEQVAYKLEQDIALWDPHNIPEGTSDAFKTLFVARINYDTSESKLRREFEGYGPIKKIAMVPDKKTGKPRGYAFIEYEHERDMHSAYKHADGKKIDGRRVLVDVERSRTVKGWLPRRLGGGLGGTRKGGPEVNVKHSGRDDASRHDSREREREREPPKERERERDKERDRDREKERERERRRSRSRTREKERRRRSVSRPRGDRRRDRRKRSRDRSRDRERDRDKENEEREVPEEMEDRKDFREDRKDFREERKDLREERKDLRDDKKDIRDDKKEVQKEIRERRRSKSRDRKRPRRSRSRDRDRERRRRGAGGGSGEQEDRDRERTREPRPENIIDGVVIKTEPNSSEYEDSHGDFSNSNQGSYSYGGAYEEDEAHQGYGAQN